MQWQNKGAENGAAWKQAEIKRRLDEWRGSVLRNKEMRLPGGPVVKNLPSSAGDSGSVPGGKLKSLMPRGTVTIDLCALEPVCHN